MKKIDIAIIGSGPAGLQAAIHASMAKADVAVFGNIEKSALFNAHIENYFGMGSIDGSSMLTTGRKQAKKFGANFFNQEILSIKSIPKHFVLITDHGDKFVAKSTIFASGVTRKKINVPGEKEFLGKGVSYCAECDAPFFKNKRVAVVGDGSSAASASIYLKNYAKKVCWICERNEASQNFKDMVKLANIKLIEGAKILAIKGESIVENLILERKGKEEEMAVDGIFIQMGETSALDLATMIGIIPKENHLQVNEHMETSCKGVFAVGDITGPPYQLAKAVGEGCIAGMNAARYVKGI
jgi:thioredoxin reductase (NADPH)